jgi:protein-disulfide isomerase
MAEFPALLRASIRLRTRLAPAPFRIEDVPQRRLPKPHAVKTEGNRAMSWRVLPAAIGLLLVAAVPVLAQDDAADPETARIEEIVRTYLLEHPEVVVEALQAYEAQRLAAQQAKQQEMLTALADQLFDNPLSPIAGNPDGDVTIVEFFDYNCPYCKKVTPDLAQLLESDGNIRFVYKEWPILSADSEIAARAALAAHQQSKDAYISLHDAMMAHRGKLDRNMIMALAATQGLNMERLETDMQGDQVSAELEHVRRLADQIGIDGTPAFLIGDTVVPGAIDIEEMQRLVAAARES